MNYQKPYLAAPFFNPEQLEKIKIVEDMCEIYGFKAFSPRKSIILPPKASLAERQRVFNENKSAMEYCDFVLACVEWIDSGTSWEMGFSHAIGKRVIGYTWSIDKMNVMVAQSCEGFLQGQEKLDEFLKGNLATGYPDWGVTKEWLEKIY